MLGELAACAAEPALVAVATRSRARLLADALDDRAGALALLRVHLSAQPGDDEARAAVEAIATSGHAEAAAASALLVSSAEATGDPRRVLEALERIAGRAAPPVAADAERRAARVHGEQLGQWAAAVAALRRAVRAEPSDAGARAELRQAAARANLDEEAVAAYEELLPGLAPQDAALAWRELALLREERLRDPAGALSAWAEARQLGSDAREALSALARLHRAAGHAPELAQVLRQQASLCEDAGSTARPPVRARGAPGGRPRR